MPLSTSPLTFWEGNIRQFLCKEFEVVDDDEVEGTEEISITLLVVCTVGVDIPPDLGTTIIKIIDNDSPVLSPSPSPSTSPEMTMAMTAGMSQAMSMGPSPTPMCKNNLHALHVELFCICLTENICCH